MLKTNGTVELKVTSRKGAKENTPETKKVSLCTLFEAVIRIGKKKNKLLFNAVCIKRQSKDDVVLHWVLLQVSVEETI